MVTVRLCIQHQLQIRMLRYRPRLESLGEASFAEGSSSPVGEGGDAKPLFGCRLAAVAMAMAVAMAGICAVRIIAIFCVTVAMAMAGIRAAGITAIICMAMAMAGITGMAVTMTMFFLCMIMSSMIMPFMPFMFFML
mmetsp:Transcript_17653/g.36908  ORF Transcript_17653/g.36908 Transcript_17653/m.36908 type:complete len:137 (-) Transcript_17653:993-1403(-)